MAFGWVKRRIWPGSLSASSAFDLYVSSAPGAQNAVDAIGGWRTSFPPQYGLNAGSLATYDDPRIRRAIACFGPLDGRHVLELGPLDGGHASMFEAAGATVDAIEADHVAFLRCLVTREILGLTRTKFWLGDWAKALEHWPQRYDLIVACGVPHHRDDPLHLIALAAKRTDALYLGTDPVVAESRPPSQQDGPAHGRHRRLHRDDLVAALQAAGFRDIRSFDDEPDRGHGPAPSLFARR
jgi:hypothetical protein